MARLNVLTFAEEGGERTPLLIAHGLFGSARNWGVIAKRLAADRRVIVPDLRNHGQSPHLPSHTYEELAADLAEVIEAQGAPVDLCGHSMGGKAAMTLALTRPDLIRRLVVADISPVPHHHTQAHLIEAMKQIDPSKVERRSIAQEALAAMGVSQEVIPFLTQSLDLKAGRWLLNLDTLADQMPHIMSWPAHLQSPAEMPALFLSGANSDYVQPEHRPIIRALFSKARFSKLKDAGHWLHAEQPRAFEATLRAFLG